MIVIDSTTYDVPIISIGRKADKLYKYAERTEDGILRSEIIGTYINYDLVMGMSSNNVEDYAALWLKLIGATESYEVTVLGDIFTAYFANIKDEVVKNRGAGEIYYRNLTFSVIATEPTITP